MPYYQTTCCHNPEIHNLVISSLETSKPDCLFQKCSISFIANEDDYNSYILFQIKIKIAFSPSPPYVAGSLNIHITIL